MTSAPTHQPPPRRRRIGPRSVSAVALVVLGLCGIAVVENPPRPTSLRSQSNWALATLLPSARDFPPDWNYALRGRVHRTHSEGAATETKVTKSTPDPVYTPGDCGPIPTLAELSGSPTDGSLGTGDAALVSVDRYAGEIARAMYVGGENTEPNAQFAIWPVADGATLITTYVDWLHHCSTYDVTATDAVTHVAKTRTVTTTVDAHFTGGTDAILVVTQSTTQTAPAPGQTLVAHVTYDWVRGVLFEYASSLRGADVEVTNHVAAQTLQRLRAA